ncbi:MAG TPA: DUF5916 domain-containing protein, partial [Longimicrobium sp.]|nr:DUF5916 domain-containing protein [Longimicrobium sp.]
MQFLRSFSAAALGVALLSAAPQAQAPASAARPPATMQAVRLQGELRLDGRLDEAAWQGAQPSTEFTQSYPDPGAAPTLRTEARVMYDDKNLYVGVRMFDPSPDSIAAPLARRDAAGVYSDWVHLIVDSRYDRRSAFRFTTNPRALQRDVYTYDDGNEDDSWNAVWDVATTVDSLGWVAEYRIPMSQLRFGGQAGDARTWGLQIMRDIARRGERASWSPWTRNDAGFVSRFGTLTGLSGVPAPRTLEIMPYASARLTRAPGNPDDPFFQENEPGMDAGADLRLGLPLGLTLSATINPDFGQVEADPAEVNLTAFETFFSERRPFFVEGKGLFTFTVNCVVVVDCNTGEGLFYSRRIGRSPQLGDIYGDRSSPEATKILGAAKI